MRPPLAISRRMGVARLVGELMVQTVYGDPVDGAALQSHGAQDRHRVLQPLGHHVAAMRQQAMVSQADPHILG